jgi:hypothetical protein
MKLRAIALALVLFAGSVLAGVDLLIHVGTEKLVAHGPTGRFTGSLERDPTQFRIYSLDKKEVGYYTNLVISIKDEWRDFDANPLCDTNQIECFKIDLTVAASQVGDANSITNFGKCAVAFNKPMR